MHASVDARIINLQRSVFLILIPTTHRSAIMADDDVVERAMVANGYTINKHGGAFRWSWGFAKKVANQIENDGHLVDLG